LLEINDIQYIDVIRYLDKDILDPTKPIGLVRELNNNLSIRAGKYGDYIFYKTAEMKNPTFLKLKGFTGDYKTCSISTIIEWIQKTYKI
jgi:hypothetical protein